MQPQPNTPAVLPPQTGIDQIVAENKSIRLAYSAALVSLGGSTPEQFSANWPGADLEVLSADPTFMRSVEVFAGMPSVQESALDAQLRRGLATSIEGLVAKIQSPDTTGAALREAGELFTKISALIDKRVEAARDGGERSLVRRVFITGDTVTIWSPEGGRELLVRGDGAALRLEMLRAMRCVTPDEVAAVLAVPLRYGARLTLQGF